MRLHESAMRRVGRGGPLAISILAAMMFIGAGSSDRSSSAEVIRLVGDFNGDGRDDIALTGPSQSSGLAVAFSNGDGTFHVTQADVGAFASRSAHRQAARLVGDFDGDGRDDIALTGVPGWTSVSVAFSDGVGGFVVTERWAGSLAAWTSHDDRGDGDGRLQRRRAGGHRGQAERRLRGDRVFEGQRQLRREHAVRRQPRRARPRRPSFP